MQRFVVFFVDFREVRTFAIPENVASPFNALCRLVQSGYGATPCRMMWADEDNNLLPILSDRSFADAFRARRDPRLPLRIFVKGTRFPGRFGGNGQLSVADENNRRQRPPVTRNDVDGHAGVNRYKPNMNWLGPERPIKQPRLMSWTPEREMPSGRMPKDEPVARPLRNFNASILPKDPSLSELVNSVRENLEAALKGVHLCVPVQTQEETESFVQRVAEPVDVVHEKVSEQKENAETVLDENQSDSVVPQQEELVRFSLEEEFMEATLRPRTFSCLSDEFTIITPSSESCPVVFDEQELEAVLSELESEDAFEIVEHPDDWDSDTDWHSAQAATM